MFVYKKNISLKKKSIFILHHMYYQYDKLLSKEQELPIEMLHIINVRKKLIWKDSRTSYLFKFVLFKVIDLHTSI